MPSTLYSESPAAVFLRLERSLSRKRETLQEVSLRHPELIDRFWDVLGQAASQLVHEFQMGSGLTLDLDPIELDPVRKRASRTYPVTREPVGYPVADGSELARTFQGTGRIVAKGLCAAINFVGEIYFHRSVHGWELGRFAMTMARTESEKIVRSFQCYSDDNGTGYHSNVLLVSASSRP